MKLLNQNEILIPNGGVEGLCCCNYDATIPSLFNKETFAITKDGKGLACRKMYDIDTCKTLCCTALDASSYGFYPINDFLKGGVNVKCSSSSSSSSSK